MATAVDLIGGFYADDSLPWADQDTLNWLPVKAEVGGTRTPIRFSTPPGLKPYQQIGTGPIRGMHDLEGGRFIVSGRYLFRISNTGVGVPIGIIPGTGRVQMTHNQFQTGNQLLVENGEGGGGYVYDSTNGSFQKITDEGYPGSISSDYLDSFLLGVEPLGRFWFHSDLANATSYNTLDRYEAEASPDRIVGLAVSQFEVVVFGQRTIEFFYNAGSATGTFQNRRQTITRGCASRHTIAKLDNTLFWLGDDGIVYRMNGYSAQPVSTGPMHRAFAGLNWSNAFAYTWEDRGFKIYYLTFPDGKTWGYDVVSGLWTRRGSFGLDRWRLTHTVKWGNDWYGGDFQSGRVWNLAWGYYLEGDQEFISERTSPCMHDNQSNIGIPSAELVFDTGQGPLTEPIPFPEQPTTLALSGDLPNGNVGETVNYQYTATGGTAPRVLAIVSGSLPPGLSMSSSGLVTGTVTQGGTFNWVVRVTDDIGGRKELPDTATFVVVPVGLEWQYTGTFGSQINDITYGDGVFVAVGLGTSPDKQIWMSPDGSAGSWVQQPTGVPASWQFNSCAFGNGIFVVSRGFNNVLTGALVSGSISWTQRTTANTDAYLVTIWSGQNFIRAGLGGSAEWSSNGITWNNSPRPGGQNATVGFVHGSSVIILGANGGISRTSNHGVSWTTSTVTADPLPSQAFTGGASDGVIIRAFKYASSILYTYTSVDGGMSFTVQQNNVGGANYQAGKLLYRNGRWIGLGATTAGLEQVKLWYSNTGLPPWLPATVSGYVDTTAATMRAIAANAFSRAVLVGTKSTTGYSMTSPILPP